MSQAEDTELRDLVIEALEKNGSLAKIRALLRANVFLAFEDDCENIKQNVSLDNILKLPEGILSLSIVHEFLEFCNLKNTLFVYMSESRQNKEYAYEGQKKLAEKLNFLKKDNTREPILVTIIKNILKPFQRKHFEQSDIHNLKPEEKTSDKYFKDDQNCTYIVHEDSSSSATSNSHSDSSADEKNKLHLRLQLDNSDTDTSSDSTRDKSSSEYIPNDHIVTEHHTEKTDKRDPVLHNPNFSHEIKGRKHSMVYNNTEKKIHYVHDLNLIQNSSDSTSYVELKPYNPLHEELLNTTGVPFIESEKVETTNPIATKSIQNDIDVLQNVDSGSSSATMNSVSSISMKNEVDKAKASQVIKTISKNTIEEKSDADTADYSLDFTSSIIAGNKGTTDDRVQSPESIQEELIKNPNENLSSGSRYEDSQSSISLSDVGDLISEKSTSFKHQHRSEKNSKNESSKLNNDTIDLTESPVQSLSNLSLDIHSD